MDFNKIIEDEINKRSADLITQNTKLAKQVTELTKKNEELKNKLDAINENADIYDAGKNIVKLIDPNYIKGLFTFKPSQKVSLGMYEEETPIWFSTILEYWDNKNDVYNIFKFFNLDIPDWATNIAVPWEWDKDECLYFVKTIGKHYVCNGQIFDNNIGFWYRDQQSRLTNARRMMVEASYSELPWQYVLQNVLWFNDNEVFDAMTASISKGEHHSVFFLEGIMKLHIMLTENQYRSLCIAAISGNKKNNYEIYKKFIIHAIDKFDITSKDNNIIDFYIKNNPGNQPRIDAPKAMHKAYVETLTTFKDKVVYIEDCKKLSAVEKASLISDAVEDRYGSIVKELLTEEV